MIRGRILMSSPTGIGVKVPALDERKGFREDAHICLPGLSDSKWNSAGKTQNGFCIT